MPYADLTKEELMELKKSLKAQYKAMQAKDLKLDMSRGKPSQEQLDISMGLMDVLSSDADLMKTARTAETTVYLTVSLRQRDLWEI